MFMNKFSVHFLSIMVRKSLIAMVVTVIVIYVGYQLIYQNQHNYIIGDYVSKQREEVSITEYVLDSTIKSVYHDLQLIRNTVDFDKYIKDNSRENLQGIEDLFVRIAENKDYFLQIRFLNAQGMEKVRINQKNNVVSIVPTQELQNKKNRYYFSSAINIDEGSMYISDFDLNIEHGVVVEPYEPTVRFAIPVYDGETSIGVLVINYDGYNLLSILDQYKQARSAYINTGILDNNTFWALKGDTIQDTMLNIENLESSAALFGNILEEIKVQEDDYFVLDGLYVAYRRIDEIPGIPLAFESGNEGWTVLSRFEWQPSLMNQGNFILTHRWLPFFLSLVAIVLILFITSMLEFRKRNQLMALASGYIDDIATDSVMILDSSKHIIYTNEQFEDMVGQPFATLYGNSPLQFLKGESHYILDKKEKRLEWKGNIWDQVEEDTFVLRHLSIIDIANVKKEYIYHIVIYSQPTFEDVFSEYIGKGYNEQRIVDKFELNKLEPIFEEYFDDTYTNVMVAIKFFNSKNLDLQPEHEMTSRYLNMVTGALKRIKVQGGIMAIPINGIVILSFPVYRHHIRVKEIMDMVDRTISSVRFNDHMTYPIQYLTGIALTPDHGKNAYELLENAFIALETLIKMKRVRYLVYDQNLFDVVKKDKMLVDEISYGLEHHEFYTVYQLQRQVKTDQIVGMEVLARWESSRLGKVTPDVFIPIMEDSLKIEMFGQYILEAVIYDLKHILKWPETIKVSINISGHEFSNLNAMKNLVRIIDNSELSKSIFCFEITETALVENLEMARDVVSYLHENEISISIDDFGTGFSSLSYLHVIQADEIKIDRMFIKDYPLGNDGKTLRAIAKMLEELNIPVVVEGIETKNQLEFIKELGLGQYQGYYGSVPERFDKISEICLQE